MTLFASFFAFDVGVRTVLCMCCRHNSRSTNRPRRHARCGPETTNPQYIICYLHYRHLATAEIGVAWWSGDMRCGRLAAACGARREAAGGQGNPVKCQQQL